MCVGLRAPFLRIHPMSSHAPRLVLAALALAVPSFSQAPTWTALTAGAAPGTPAEWVELPAQSTAQLSVFELRLHGFWQTPVVGPNGVSYTRLEFPGLGTVGQVGWPELPAARPWLAVTTSSPLANFVSAVTPAGQLAVFTLRPYPQPVPGLDEPLDPTNAPGAGDGDGTAEVFAADAGAYTNPIVWPPNVGNTFVPVQTYHGTLPLAQPQLHPVRWTATTQQLEVSRRLVVTYAHTGSQLAFAPITLDRWKLGRAMCVNWTTAGSILTANPTSWNARYLFVAPQALVPTLQTLVDRRREFGFTTSVVTLESLGATTPTAIRAAIQGWYAAGNPAHDHYCLLVGDAGALPLAPPPSSAQSPGDDSYGSVDAVATLREQIYVGRLSVDDAADLAHQIAKIIAYEEDTIAAHDYSRATVASHKDGAPQKYELAVNGVAAIPYADPPVLSLRHGAALGSSGNAAIAADLAAGRGIVAYRGHGTANEWFGWNGAAVGWHKNDVIGASNAMLPVVWSVACNHNRIDEAIDSLGETWLEASAGGVAHYGATRAGATKANDALIAALFSGLYDDGIATHGPLIALAEDRMLAAHPAQADTAWGSLLLGDPAMRVRRHAPNGLRIVSTPTIPACPGTAPCSYTVKLEDGNGVPIAGGLVTAYKPGDIPGGPDEVFFTAVTDANGNAGFPGPTSLGYMKHVGRDDTGDVAQDLPPVQTGAFISLGDALPGTGGKNPKLSSDSELQPGSQLSIQLNNALGNTFGVLAVSVVDTPLPLFGGVVHTFPIAAQFQVATSAIGKWSFNYAPWPNGLAPGSTFYFQAGLLDAGAIEGFALSNCLKGETP